MSDRNKDKKEDFLVHKANALEKIGQDKTRKTEGVLEGIRSLEVNAQQTVREEKRAQAEVEAVGYTTRYTDRYYYM
jgi:hypothetical protein